MPTGGEGGDAAPADSGADASVRLAGRTARTRWFINFVKKFLGKRLRDEREQKYAIFSNSSRYSGFFTFRPEKDFCIFTPVRRFVFKPVLKF